MVALLHEHMSANRHNDGRAAEGVPDASDAELRRGNLKVRHVRELVVPARGVHGVVRGEALVEVVVQVLQRRGDDARAAGRAGRHDERAGVQVLGDGRRNGRLRAW
jgi:hypothetical protein